MSKFTDHIIDRWHLEVTSKCTLACPRCVRVTESPNTPYKGVDIDVDNLYKFFTDEVLETVYRIIFVGNYGDPIYHPQFHNIISFFKSKNKRVSITTNGFGRSNTWWINLLKLLDENDILEFSIDGLSDTNHIYRINSQWDSVYKGLELACQSNVYIGWKFIVFKHNQHQVEEAQKIAKDIGVTEFTLVRSNRWVDGNDYLMPDKKWINKDWTIPRDVKNISDKIIEPRCLYKTPHFVSADGIYSPCCWIAVHPSKNPFYKHRDKFDISKNTLNDILTSKEIIEFEQSLLNFDTSNNLCKRHCSKTSHIFSKDNPSIDSSREAIILK